MENPGKLVPEERSIHKHKKGRQLRPVQEWLRTILMNIGDAVVATDTAGTITCMNPIAERLVGIKQEFCLGRPLVQVMQTTMEGSDTTLQSKDGRTIPIDLSISPMKDKRSQEVGFLWVFRDATERRKSEIQLPGNFHLTEVKYRTFLEQIPAASYISVSGNMVYASPQLEKIFGLTREEWLADPQIWIKRIHPDDLQRVLERRSLAYENAEPFRAEYRIITKGGSTVWILDNATAIQDENGRTRFLQGVLLDITDQKNAEIQLQGSHQQLRALSRHLQNIREEERSKISWEVHDDLGQLLTALKMNLTLLGKKVMVSARPLSKRWILNELASLSQIVSSAVQRVQQIASELRPKILDHLGLRSAMEWHLQEFQARTGAVCRCECEFENVDLPSDSATAMFRIFQETLTNVARHAKATRVNVQLKLIDRYLQMQITDNGIGISEANIADAESLGLLGMRERALLLGGEFRVIGEKGVGTTVSLKIPL